MIVLAADTSTPINTVSLTRDDQLLAETVVSCGRKHSERLLETVDWVLAEAGLTLADTDLLAVAIGPGSFTGLRIGVATWKGLALGLNRPLIGVSTLDAMARLGTFHNGIVCPLIDAKMAEVYGAAYEFTAGVPTKLTEERVGPIEQIVADLTGPVVFLGDGAILYRDRLCAAVPQAIVATGLNSVLRASAVAAEAQERHRLGAPADAGLVNPVYLRKSQPEEMREKASLP